MDNSEHKCITLLLIHRLVTFNIVKNTVHEIENAVNDGRYFVNFHILEI
jgi:hypothetical protein